MKANVPIRAAIIDKERLSALDALRIVFADQSASTKRSYARIFRDFQRWAGVQQIADIEQLDTLAILHYKQHLKLAGQKNSSINQALSALRKIFRVLAEFSYISSNPLKSTLVRSEKVNDISLKGAIPIALLYQMLDVNQHMEYDFRMEKYLRLRNRLLMRFLYLTAARRSEAAQLQWSAIQRDGKFTVAILAQTKSGVPQRLKLRTELAEEMQLWRKEIALLLPHSPWVFPSLSQRTLGQPLTGKGVNDVVVKLGQAVGLKISAHYLRHTAITMALELGEPIQKVKAYARHSSANTTIRYYHDQEVLQKNPTDRLPLI